MSVLTTETAAYGSTPTIPEPGPPQVEVFGIRHHGPGSARSLLAALEAYRPDAVLIEGPADADPQLRWAAAAGMEPPIALLAYAPDRPALSAFWPYAVFSPEWQALTWALRHEIHVAFCDLPASMTLAGAGRAEHGDEQFELFDGDDEGEEDGPSTSSGHEEGSSGRTAARHDPLAAMAEAAGYDDAERWWDDVIEARLDGSSPFPMLIEAMAELRTALGQPGGREGRSEARREAYMRQTIRATLKAGYRRVAVVCGAWHAPVLTLPLPPATLDQRTLRGTPKRKVTLTWVPWTHQRLASATGYGAGITSPGWYHHLWSAPDKPIVRWLTKVAHSLRGKDLPVSSAHVIEAVRLAETLAVLRDRPLAGLAEVSEATRAVLCDGDEVAVRYVTDELVVGQALGAVDDGVPTVPLEADLNAQCRALRIKRDASAKIHDLDLRKDYDQRRSVLFHRLQLLGLDWIAPAESWVQSQGTFRETWESQWRPELSVALVEASLWGTTVESAASAKVGEIVESGSLQDLTGAIEGCLLADLPAALGRLLGALAERAALDADVIHLMEALPPLVRAQRYGDVRGTDTQQLAVVAETLVVRICLQLPQAVGGIEEEHAATLRGTIDRVQQALGLLAAAGDHTQLRQRWFATLAQIIDRADVNGQLLGRMVRILHDAEQLDDAADRVHRALSYGVEAAAKAAWVDGFFADGALLLIHDATLRRLLDDWVSSLAEQEFADVLPLVRRTLGTFSAPERQSIGGRITADSCTAPGLDPGAEIDEHFDLERARPALDTVDLILGGRRG